MMRILVDADASIKLKKLALFDIFVSGFEVILTSDVYDEHMFYNKSRT